MNRKQPANPNPGQPWPPEVAKQSALSERTMKVGSEETKIQVETRTYQLLTPLFGGGVEASTNDPDCPIRGSEIRGQLRFWWRATRGGQEEFEGQRIKMKEREDEIWGAASNTRKQKERGEQNISDKNKPAWHEPVQIEVEIDQIGDAISPFKPDHGGKPGTYKSVPMNGIPDYAAFPLRPDNERLQRMGLDTPVTDVRKNVTFSIKVTYPTKWAKDVKAALWAWETFGGVGGRTRRGFGVLMKIDKKADLPTARKENAEEWLQKNLKKWCAQGTFPKDVPHLTNSPHFELIETPADPLHAWSIIINKYKDFRQWRRYYKDERGKEKPGRSKWPEAEMIRNQTKSRSSLRLPINQPPKLPRAHLGLPIVFHFKDKKSGDPPDITLQGSGEYNRMSSPLILRPLICQDGKALGLALYLAGTHLPENLSLESGKGRSIPLKKDDIQLTAEDAARLPILGGQTDIIEAFLDYLRLGKDSKFI